jgi:outer membrane lipoprotein-sorting protein
VNLLSTALERYQRLDGYRATIKSFRQDDGEIIHYHYQRPGRIRMEFVKPHKGAILTYNPDNQRVYLWPLGTMLIPPVVLSPDNPLVQSSTGQRVDHSDIGSLLANILHLQDGGATELHGEETVDGRPTVHLSVRGAPNAAPGKVQRYDIWLDKSIELPRKVVSYDGQGHEIETVVLEDLEIDPAFPARFFVP